MDKKLLTKVIKMLQDKVTSNFIMKTTVLSKTDVLLSFSFYRDEQLFISLNHNNPFVGLVKKKEDLVTVNGNLNEQLKQRVRNTYIEEINQPTDDRIIQFKLSFSDDFHARYMVKEKEYQYKLNMGEYSPIDRRYVYQYGKKLDIDKMKKAITYFLGNLSRSLT